MKTLTVDSVMKLSPCYSREQVAELFGERKRVSVAEALSADLSTEDRIWLGIRCLPARAQRLFACACAERALRRECKAGREPDQRLWEAVRVARRFARGRATGEELAAAYAAHAAYAAYAYDASSEREWQLAWIRGRVR